VTGHQVREYNSHAWYDCQDGNDIGLHPCQAALEDNHQLYDVNQPIEILRTIHSFDPCIACAVHLSDADGKEITQVKVR
jgi:Ni,Fe-hydrogenase I large subunit